MKKCDYRGVTALRLVVPQKDIYYISWNIDVCEGLAFLETTDAKAGLVTIYAPTALLGDVYSLLDGLRVEGIQIEIVEADEITK